MFKVGDMVVTADTVRPVRFAKQTGVVAQINRRDNEVGVQLGSTVTWFRPSEVRKVPPDAL